jgi:hypothetical protein
MAGVRRQWCLAAGAKEIKGLAAHGALDRIVGYRRQTSGAQVLPTLETGAGIWI